MRVLRERAEIVAKKHERIYWKQPEHGIRPPTDEPGESSSQECKPTREDHEIAKSVTVGDWTGWGILYFFSSAREENRFRGTPHANEPSQECQHFHALPLLKKPALLP